MSEQEKYETNIYIVDSVKGGCGKSSLAIWKAIEIATKAKDDQEKKQKTKEVLKEEAIIKAIDVLETNVNKTERTLEAITDNNIKEKLEKIHNKKAKEELADSINNTAKALEESINIAKETLETIRQIFGDASIETTKEELKKSIKTAKELLKELKEPSKSVCYIDLDLLGTSIENMLGLQQKDQYYYLNDLFSGDRMAVQKKRVKRDFDLDGLQIDSITQTPRLYQFVYNADRTNSSEKSVSIGMVFSSPNQKQKNKFRVGHSTDGHHIDFDFFARRLNELFNELIDGGVTDFVIDMPPNSDPYTDSIFGQFLKREIKRRKIGVHLLLISSLDRAHLEANKQWLIDLCNKSTQRYEFTSVEYYFNDIRNNLEGKRSDEKEIEVKQLVGKIVSDMKDVCNCKEQQSYLVEHNIYLSGYAIWQGGNPDQEPPSDSTFPSISTIPVNFEE